MTQGASTERRGTQPRTSGATWDDMEKNQVAGPGVPCTTFAEMSECMLVYLEMYREGSKWIHTKH